MGKIIFNPKKTLWNKVRPFTVYFNGEVLAEVKNNKKIEVEVPSGKHFLQVGTKMGAGSQLLEVDIEENEIKEIGISLFKGYAILETILVLDCFVGLGFILNISFFHDHFIWFLFLPYFPLLLLLLYYRYLAKEKFVILQDKGNTFPISKQEKYNLYA